VRLASERLSSPLGRQGGCREEKTTPARMKEACGEARRVSELSSASTGEMCTPTPTLVQQRAPHALTCATSSAYQLPRRGAASRQALEPRPVWWALLQVGLAAFGAFLGVVEQHGGGAAQLLFASPSELSASPSKARSVTQRALSVTQRALSVTQRALSVTQRALSVTQRALRVTQRALSVTQRALSVTQRALSVT
jgi:hypothetical protein